MVRVPADNDKIFACVRHLDGCCKGNTVVAVMNMSDKEQEVTLDLNEYDGTYRCLCGKKHKLNAEQKFSLKPWQFKIFVR